MKHASALLTGVLLTLCLVVAPSRSHASFPGRNGRILFTAVPSGSSSIELFTVEPDGADRERLTFNNLEEQWPSWSPHGTRIAFSAGGANRDIFVMNSNGSGTYNLTESPGEDDATPAWSPDGEWIAMSTGGDLWKERPNGSGRMRLTDLIGSEDDPAWSPDGSRIVFTHYLNAQADIEVVRLSDLEIANLTDNEWLEQDPDWSPDGSKIAFSAQRPVPGGDMTFPDIWAMDADGSNQLNLTNTILNLPFEEDPTWSPQGDRIAFEWQDGEGLEIALIDSRGGAKLRVTETSGVDHQDPAWEPIPYYPCTIWGTPTAESLTGGDTSDVLCGLEGNDSLYGGKGDDSLYGAGDADSLWGEYGSDYLVGGTGWDILRGGRGDDREIGGKGNDVFFDSNGIDLFKGGPGDDQIDAQDGQPGDVVIGGMGTDACEHDAGDTVRTCE